jgi:hypothetical protein
MYISYPPIALLPAGNIGLYYNLSRPRPVDMNCTSLTNPIMFQASECVICCCFNNEELTNAY